jgi:hypothetical protein
MGPPERHIEDIYVAKMYCASSFKRNRFVQGQIVGKSLCFCSTRYRNPAQPVALSPYVSFLSRFSPNPVFGYLPARKAALLNPVMALASE